MVGGRGGAKATRISNVSIPTPCVGNAVMILTVSLVSFSDGWQVGFAWQTGNSTFHAPAREESDWDYRPLNVMELRDRTKPHLAIIMGDSKIPYNEEEMLVSELHAAAEMSKRQLCRPSLNKQQTRPVRLHPFQCPFGSSPDSLLPLLLPLPPLTFTLDHRLHLDVRDARAHHTGIFRRQD